MDNYDSIVVGGGVVGVSAAYFLAKRGQRVCLIEQNEICSGCSQGNAGQVTPGHLPLPVPGTMWRNIRWLFDSKSPLFVAPRLDLSLLRWLIRFQLACNPKHLRMATQVLCELGAASMKLYDSLAEQLDIPFQHEGRIEVCYQDSTLNSALHEAEMLRDFGFEFERLVKGEVSRFEPAIQADVAGAIYYPDSAATDPHQFVMRLAEAAREMGVVIREQTQVDSLQVPNDQSVRVSAGDDVLEANSLVLTQGSWAPKIAKQLGQRLPIQPGKGYHIELNSNDDTPSRPVVLLEERIFVTPLPHRLRLAGTMEFSGFNLNCRQKRADMLVRGAARYFPSLDSSQTTSTWCHLRPMTSDGLPIIGPLERHPNVCVGTGHGMLGITQGPITGKLLSEWICDGKTSIELAKVSPSRF